MDSSDSESNDVDEEEEENDREAKRLAANKVYEMNNSIVFLFVFGDAIFMELNFAGQVPTIFGKSPETHSRGGRKGRIRTTLV